MSQLINFKDFSLPDAAKYRSQTVCGGNDGPSPGREIEVDDAYKLTLNILVHNNPNKTSFTIKETANQLNVSEEFIRRRIKSNHIKAIYFGDKPMITIVELARILTQGV
jgi:excisionase family DNA binding protein